MLLQKVFHVLKEEINKYPHHKNYKKSVNNLAYVYILHLKIIKLRNTSSLSTVHPTTRIISHDTHEFLLKRLSRNNKPSAFFLESLNSCVKGRYYFFLPFTMAAKPLKTYRIAGVSFSIFRNERQTKDGRSFTTYTGQVQRSYQKEDGKTAYTDSLGVADWLIAASLLQKAYNEQVDQTAGAN